MQTLNHDLMLTRRRRMPEIDVAEPVLYTPKDLDLARLPQHVAVIMDGNGRWAQQRGLPRIAGHRQGVAALKIILRCCKNWGIPALTAYAFSTENWRRPEEEVTFLLRLFEQVLRQDLEELGQEGIHLRLIGDLSSLPRSLQAVIQEAMEITSTNQTVHLTIALNYGGRDEILRACRQLATQVQQQKLDPDAIDANCLTQALDTAGLPDLDLLIRTSGEMRLSNFLLWQAAYAELIFSPVLWPDFNSEEFFKILYTYQNRSRRFGQI